MPVQFTSFFPGDTGPLCYATGHKLKLRDREGTALRGSADVMSVFLAKCASETHKGTFQQDASDTIGPHHYHFTGYTGYLTDIPWHLLCHILPLLNHLRFWRSLKSMQEMHVISNQHIVQHIGLQ